VGKNVRDRRAMGNNERARMVETEMCKEIGRRGGMDWGISQQKTASASFLPERGYFAATSLQARAQIIMVNLEVTEAQTPPLGDKRQWILNKPFRSKLQRIFSSEGTGARCWTCYPVRCHLMGAPEQMKCLWQMTRKKADNIRNNKEQRTIV
jgi:hypothetical protein